MVPDHELRMMDEIGDLKAEVERLRAALLSAHEAMLNWHCLSQEERDEATNAAILNEQKAP